MKFNINVDDFKVFQSNEFEPEIKSIGKSTKTLGTFQQNVTLPKPNPFASMKKTEEENKTNSEKMEF